MVVDTQLRPSWARDLITEIRKVTDKPVRYVINTHWHGDHTLGNQAYVAAFGPDVAFVAQTNTREDLIVRGAPQIETQRTKTLPDSIAALEKQRNRRVDLPLRRFALVDVNGGQRSYATIRACAISFGLTGRTAVAGTVTTESVSPVRDTNSTSNPAPSRSTTPVGPPRTAC